MNKDIILNILIKNINFENEIVKITVNKNLIINKSQYFKNLFLQPLIIDL